MKLRDSFGTVTASVLVWLYAAILIVPMSYLLLSSVKSNLDIFNDPFGLPENWRWSNYSKAWQIAHLDQALLNSVLVTVVAVVVTLGLAVPAAYSLALTMNKASDRIQATFSLGFLIPPFAALIPTVLLAIELGLFQSRLFLVVFLPAGALPLSVLLLTAFMRTIPRELAEAAEMDGAGRWRTLYRVYLPLTMPGIVTVIILQALGFWNEFFYSLVITGTAVANRTVQVALPVSLIGDSTKFGVLAAGTVISLIPVYVAYSLAQKRMYEALTDGAVKG